MYRQNNSSFYFYFVKKEFVDENQNFITYRTKKIRHQLLLINKFNDSFWNNAANKVEIPCFLLNRLNQSILFSFGSIFRNIINSLLHHINIFYIICKHWKTNSIFRCIVIFIQSTAIQSTIHYLNTFVYFSRYTITFIHRYFLDVFLYSVIYTPEVYVFLCAFLCKFSLKIWTFLYQAW